MDGTISDSTNDLLELQDYTSEGDNSMTTGIETSSSTEQVSTRLSVIKKTFEVVVLSTVIVTVWVLLSLPTVFFHIHLSDVNESNFSISCSSKEYITQPWCDNDTEISSASGSYNITCNEDFFMNATTGSCRPHCGQWEEYPHTKQVISDAVIGTAACIGIAVTVFILVLACVRDRNLLKFPSVMIIYQNLTVCVFSVQALIGFMDRDLFCSSTDLLQTFQHSTPFCTLTGIGVIYTTLPLAVWALIHVVISLWAIHFPFHYSQFKKTRKMKAVHISSILVGIILPLIPAIITIKSGGFSVLDTRYPPIACRARNRYVTVYALIVPVSIVLAIGVTSQVFILRNLIKHYGPRKSRGAQIRILIIFFYYALLGLVAVTAFTVSSKQLPKFTREISAYFQCESTGNKHCSRDGFEQYTNPTVVTIAYSIVEVYPVVTLVFAIPSRDLKKLKRIFNKKWRTTAV